MNSDLCVVFISMSICHICSMKCMCDTRVTHPPWCICGVDAMEYISVSPGAL